MQKILIACNTLTSIAGEVYQNHASFYYRLGKEHPEFDFHMFFARRVSIDRFRNTAVKTAKDLNCAFILFIDDDMKMPRGTFQKLLDAVARGYGIVSALNYIRGYPFKLMSFRYQDPEAERRNLQPITEKDIVEGQVIPVDAIGTAVCLIDMTVLENTPGPWFITGPYHTEDIYFCIKAKDYNKELKIGTHCGIITTHLLDNEGVSFNTVEHLRKYEESYMSPEEIARHNGTAGDRGEGYIRNEIETALAQVVK